MTNDKRAGFGRIAQSFAVALGMSALLALAACDQGPDRAKVAEELKTGVEAQLKLMEGAGEEKIFSHTAVTVTPQDDESYLVAIEGVKVEPAPDGYLDVGTISYRAKPKDEKSYEVSDLTVPENMPFKDKDGKEQGKLTMTTKAFSGLWSTELQNFQKLDAAFSGLSASDDKGADVRIADVRFQGEVTDKGGGLFDSAGSATLSGLATKDDQNGTFTVGEMRVDGKYDSMKVLEFQAAARKYQELAMKQFAQIEAQSAAQPASPDQPPAPPAPLSAEEQKAMADAILVMAASIKGGDFKVALKDLRYSDGSDTPFALAALNVASTIDGINQDKATLTFDIGHDGLALAMDGTSSPLEQATLPKTGNLGLKVTNVPSKDLVKVLADNMPGLMSSDPTMAQANAMAMVFALEAVFQTSGAKIEVTPSQLLSQLVEVKADGAFEVTPQAALGVIGGLNVVIRGMDDLMALAQQTPEDPDAQQAMGAVGMLSQFSAREQGTDGKPIDKFKVEVNANGQILVNGKPM